MKPIVNIYRLGRKPFVKTLNIQKVLFDNLKRAVTSSDDHYNAKVIDNIRQAEGIRERIRSILETYETRHSSPQQPELRVSNSLILVEHEPVYTVGLRAQLYDQDYVERLKSRLAENGLKADFVHTNRGGLITFHGPGQLVAYPIIHLGDFPKTILNKSVKAYVGKLEETIISTLASVGVEGAHTVREHPGVWLAGGERKIAFVGITCKRYVTMHGISINCDCDLSWFDHIVSCGIEDKQITSVYRESRPSSYQLGGGLTHDESKHVSSNRDGDNLSQNNTNQSSVLDPGSSGSRYSVQNIANAFCSSFARHFDCELLEG